MYKYETTVKLRDTDAAGVMFFTSQLRIAHDAYESLFQELGFGLDMIIRDKDYALPIVHTQADYKTPVTVGDLLCIEVTVERIGETSFELQYIFKKGAEVSGTAKIVHVAVDKQSHQKILIPQGLRAALEKIKP
ncbi:MAG: acyl-CoA thioesterase [Candidatus Omnitrophica bacterium]|nr:acyl-CoA thioesterase [Candidatus Omnitrophota bacterium]